MYDEEEIISGWEREGGKFLLENGVIDSDDLEEVKRFRRKIEEEEIEKNGYENGLKKQFSFVKESERRDKKMSYYEYADSADNDTGRELIDEIKDFYDDEEIEGLEKALKVLPEKLREALKESFKILNSYKSEMEDIPDLLAAVKLLGRLATGKPGKEPYPYPYPGGKLKKSNQAIPWSDMLQQMFPDEDEDEDFEKSDEKPSRERPWPTFGNAIKKRARKLEKIQDEMERNTFNPYDRMA